MTFFQLLWQIFKPTWRKSLITLCLFVARFIFDFLLIVPLGAFFSRADMFLPDRLLTSLFTFPVSILLDNSLKIYPPSIGAILIEIYGFAIAPFLSWYIITCIIIFLIGV